MIGGFYRPEAGSIRLGTAELAAPRLACGACGVARTYQTTQLFAEMSVLDNLMHCGRGGSVVRSPGGERARAHAG